MINMFKKVLNSFLFVSCVQAQPPVLQNLGNSCYVNALLQNLFNLPELNDMVMSDALSQKCKDNYFVMAYRDLVQEQFATMPQRTVSVGDFSKGLMRFYAYVGDCFLCGGYTGNAQCSQRLPYEQQDASDLFFELTSLIFQAFPKAQSEKVMMIAMQSFLDCTPKSKHKSVNSEIITALPLSVQSGFLEPYTTLSECFKNYFAVNEVTYKPEDKQNDILCKQYYALKNIPEYLVVLLKRFVSGEKLTHSIAIPDKIAVIGSSEKFYQVTVDDRNAAETYDLIGAVLHSGLLSFGHYRAYVKDQYDPLELWYECNDHIITKIGKELLHEQHADIDNNAYMLFYKKSGPKGVYFVDQLAHECAVLAQLYTA